MNQVIATIALLAVIALIAGGYALLKKPGERFRGVLMIVAALVLLGNVLIWAPPL
ncbi:MAG: hypothetical protein ACKVOJ_06570 [Sphingomonadaceae bacterium]